MQKSYFIISLIIINMLNWQNVILAEPDESIKSLSKSQDVDEIEIDRLSFKEQIIFDAESILNSPRRMGMKGYLVWGTILSTAGLMYIEKKDIRDWIQDNRTSSADDISGVARPLGDKLTAPAIAVGLYMKGLLSDDRKSKETGVMIMESFCYTGILTLAGEYIFAEERPEDGGKMHFFKTRGHGISGHSALASCIAGPLNREYFQIKKMDTNSTKLMKYAGKSLVYGYPVLTGLSRLNDDKHYSWNVLLGLALGYTIGELVADAHTESKKKGISLMPSIDGKDKTITISIKF